MPANDILKHPDIEAIREQFANLVHRREPNECWPWLGSVDTNNYGLCYLGGTRDRAHRVAYVLANGPIGRWSDRRSLSVCHECDNPICCNPAHLFEGTDADNMADKIAKGRQPRGAAHHRSKLTSSQVQAVQQDTRPVRVIAAELGVSAATVYNAQQDAALVRDKMRARRAANAAKLTDEQVYAIRADNRSGKDIAADYAIGMQNVYHIKRRSTWAHLPARPEDVKTGGKRGRPRGANPQPVRPPKKLALLRRAVEALIASREEMDEGWFIPTEAMLAIERAVQKGATE